MSQAVVSLQRRKLEEKLADNPDKRYNRVLGSFFEEYPEGRIGDYEIVDVLGSGKQGLVFDAIGDDGKEYVAKVVAGNLVFAEYDNLLRAIQRGIKVSKFLDNPHFPKLIEVIEHDEFFIAVREKVNGKSLAEIIHEKGRMNADELVPILESALEGLEYLHGEEVVHRDVKPGHLYVDENNFVRFIDMDTSKEEGSDDTALTGVGTFTYRHPAQEIGDTDVRCDLYSLGCSAVEALVGGLPREVLISRIQGAKQYNLPQRIPEELRNILDKLVNANLDHNYQNAREVITDLQNYRGTALVPLEEKVLVGFEEIEMKRERAKRILQEQMFRAVQASIVGGVIMAMTAWDIIPGLIVAGFGLGAASVIWIPGYLIARNKFKKDEKRLIEDSKLKLRELVLDPRGIPQDSEFVREYENRLDYENRFPQLFKKVKGNELKVSVYSDGSFITEVETKEGFKFELTIELERESYGKKPITTIKLKNDKSNYLLYYDSPFNQLINIYDYKTGLLHIKQEDGFYNSKEYEEASVLLGEFYDFMSEVIPGYFPIVCGRIKE